MRRFDMDPITLDELVKAWGIKPRLRVWVGGNDRDARRLVEGVLADRETVRPMEGSIDAAFVTAKDAEEALYFLDKLVVRLVDHAIVWIVMGECGGDRPEREQETVWPLDASCLDGWTATSPVRVVGGFLCIRVDRLSPG